MPEPSPEAAPGPTGPSPKRALSPGMAGLIFLALLMVGFVWTQYNAYSGPAIGWLSDLDGALARAAESRRRVFLYLCEPDCPTTREHDRSLFSRRLARETLARMVPCRIVLKPGDPLRERFHFQREPLAVMLNASGQVIGEPVEGLMTELTFSTRIRPE